MLINDILRKYEVVGEISGMLKTKIYQIRLLKSMVNLELVKVIDMSDPLFR